MTAIVLVSLCLYRKVVVVGGVLVYVLLFLLYGVHYVMINISLCRHPIRFEASNPKEDIQIYLAP